VPRDAHLVAALHFFLDSPFDRQARVERVFELTVGRRAARQPARELQAAARRQHHRVDAVADRDVDDSIFHLDADLGSERAEAEVEW